MKELLETGKPEAHEKLAKQVEDIHEKWETVKRLFEDLKQKPLKELEEKFVALHGNILSEIDNIKRKAKKARLDSPETNYIQEAIDSLQVRLLVYLFEVVTI